MWHRLQAGSRQQSRADEVPRPVSESVPRKSAKSAQLTLVRPNRIPISRPLGGSKQFGPLHGSPLLSPGGRDPPLFPGRPRNEKGPNATRPPRSGAALGFLRGPH